MSDEPEGLPAVVTPKMIRAARRMVAMFWAFTVLYLVLSVALVLIRGMEGLVFIAILACSWLFQGWPDTKPHFAVLRDERVRKALLRDE